MSTPSDLTRALFGGALEPDPGIALPEIEAVLPRKRGPLHRVQYVIEFVGPRSMTASAAVQLLLPTWSMPLGYPQLYVMRGNDLGWQHLLPVTDGSYDSLAMAWDFITPAGKLSKASASNLLKIAEDFGPFVSRRAIAIPTPNEVDSVVRGLVNTREALDVGFALSVAAPIPGYREKDLWLECARLGLQFENGGFDWKVPDHPHPLLTVTPYGQTDAFSLAGVQAGLLHSGVTIGFHLPRSVAPTQGLEGCFRVANHFVQRLGGVVLDENDAPLTDPSREHLRQELKTALSLFSKAGMTTGSPESLRLFGIP